MSITSYYTPEVVQVSLSPDATLTELSFSIETTIVYLIGRSANQWSIKRSKGSEGKCNLTFRTLKEVGPLRLSVVSLFGSAVRQGIIPISLSEDWKSKSEGLLYEGQNINKQTSTTTVIQQLNVDPKTTLGLLAYGLSDLITGLFYRKCKYVQWQGSLEKTQFLFEHDMTTQQLEQFFQSPVDYDIKASVSILSK